MNPVLTEPDPVTTSCESPPNVTYGVSFTDQTTASSDLTFEPANPPLLDPFLLQYFSLEDMEKELRKIQHMAVLKRLADFIPNRPSTVIHHRPVSVSPPPVVSPLPTTPDSILPIVNWTFHNSSNTNFHNTNTGVQNINRRMKRFTPAQTSILEEFYQKYGSARICDRHELAKRLGLYKNDVIGWFQSRRRKDRRAMEASNWKNRQQQHTVK